MRCPGPSQRMNSVSIWLFVMIAANLGLLWRIRRSEPKPWARALCVLRLVWVPGGGGRVVYAWERVCDIRLRKH